MFAIEIISFIFLSKHISKEKKSTQEQNLGVFTGDWIMCDYCLLPDSQKICGPNPFTKTHNRRMSVSYYEIGTFHGRDILV